MPTLEWTGIGLVEFRSHATSVSEGPSAALACHQECRYEFPAKAKKNLRVGRLSIYMNLRGDDAITLGL